MSCEVGEMLPPAAAPPLDDGNLLSEILLRLPPLPSSLPRASLVCKRWRCLTSDPAFARRFRIHHRRNPPLLGYFHGDFDGLRFEPVHFEPTLEAPDRVPPGRLSLQFDSYARVLGCRHGLVLILDQAPVQLLVWDPVTGHQHRLPTHTEFDLGNFLINGVVLRSAAGEVHFQVVLVVSDYEKRQRVVVGWVCSVSGFTVQLWKRKHDFDGVASWGMERTIELDKLLSMDSEDSLTIQGYAEDNNLAFLWTGRSVFMVKLEPFQCEKLLDTNKWDRYYPFETVYAAGT
ncbi:uncharacterized protein [Aegilops tauschii subsp. strangulata]|nr:uncharacterized protein LOC109750903 [Aegilops tauschii subsp. strangulata]